jgi:hypothetical protein
VGAKLVGDHIVKHRRAGDGVSLFLNKYTGS